MVVMVARRTSAETWRNDIPPEDTAPSGPASTPALLESWGVSMDEAREMLRRQVCPVCGEGPWKSPLIHASKRHGLDRFTMRELVGITTVESVADPEMAERMAERMKDWDGAAASVRGKRGKYRTTTAGRAATAANLAHVTAEQSRASLAKAKTPEAQSKRSATLCEKWAAKSPEERAEWGAQVGGDREHMDMMRAARPLKPCGTRSAYRRGCRCEECRAAYLAYRKAHG